MPGADENERVKRLYSKALMGSNAFRDLIRDMVETPSSPFMSLIDRMPPPPTGENRGGDAFPTTLRSPRPRGGKTMGLINTARNFFKKQPVTLPSTPNRGESLLFSYANDAGLVRGRTSDLIVLDEVQDIVDDFSLIERPVSPIIQDRPQWGESPLLGAFKDMQDSTLYRQEVMGTFPDPQPPIGGRPYFQREDVLRAYQQGLVSQKTLMEQLNIAVEAPEPRVAVPRIVPKEIKSEEFVKSKFQLMPYPSDVRTILAEQTAASIIDAEDAAFLATMTRATQAPPPKPVPAPLVNPDYGDAYRFVDARTNQVRVVGWISLDKLSTTRRVKTNERPELGPGSTQPRKRRCGRNRGAMSYGAFSAVMIPELVGDRWCPHCREPVKMSQDMDRPNGQRVLCAECWSLKKTDRTAYEARIKRMPPTCTQRIGVPVYQCLSRPNLP